MRRRRIAVRGLVRLRERLRAEVGRGLDAQALAQLRREVETAVARLESSFLEAGVSWRQVATPTRNALRDLKAFDFESVRTGDLGLGPSVRMKGLVAASTRLLDAAAAEAASEEGVRESARRSVEKAESALAEAGASADMLPERSREALVALRALVEPGRAEEVRDTVARARAEARTVLGRFRAREERPVEIRLRPSATLWRLRERRAVIEVELGESFAGAPDDVLGALVEWALVRRAGGRGIVEAWLQATRRAARGVPEGAKGLVHDLDELFVGLNREHFGGRLGRPELGWTRAATVHKFGSYTYASDRLVLSSTLDSARVPRFVVEYVLYHEMLHKALGLRQGKMRARAHTREFREAENRFPRAREAQEFVDRLGRRARR